MRIEWSNPSYSCLIVLFVAIFPPVKVFIPGSWARSGRTLFLVISESCQYLVVSRMTAIRRRILSTFAGADAFWPAGSSAPPRRSTSC